MSQTSERHRYVAYGLRLSANEAVPGLIPAEFEDQAADVRIDMGAFPMEIQTLLEGPSSPWPHIAAVPEPADDHPSVTTFEGGGFFRIQYDWGVDFVFDSTGARIWCAWREQQSLDHAALYLTGPVLGFILRLRGLTCLHASAVVFSAGAVGLVGASGAGKSTTAMALGSRGHAVLADDVLAVRAAQSTFMAAPAHRRLRLWPDALQQLEGADHARPQLVADWEKRYVDLAAGSIALHERPATLAVLYLLGAGDATSAWIEPLRPAEALPLLAAHTYRADWLSPAMRAEEFTFLATLLARVPVRRLRRPDDLTALGEICDAIVADVGDAHP